LDFEKLKCGTILGVKELEFEFIFEFIVLLIENIAEVGTCHSEFLIG